MFPAIPSVGNPCVENRCSACCHDTEMLLTDADMTRLAALRPGETFWVEADGFRHLRTRDAPPVAGMTGRPCWFLNPTGRCTVHDDRPEGCRLYPAILDVDADAVALDEEHCPHTDGFRLPTATQDAVRRLVERLEREADMRTRGSKE
jgi:uncharacterized protein